MIAAAPDLKDGRQETVNMQCDEKVQALCREHHKNKEEEETGNRKQWMHEQGEKNKSQSYLYHFPEQPDTIEFLYYT